LRAGAFLIRKMSHECGGDVIAKASILRAESMRIAIACREARAFAEKEFDSVNLTVSRATQVLNASSNAIDSFAFARHPGL
jgi:hypothetical protein